MRKYGIDLDRNVNLKAGVTGGLIAGAVMMLALMGYTAVIGLGFWTPVEAIGATFYGSTAMLGGVAPILTGIAIHALTSAVLGAIFAYSLSPVTTTGAAVSLGVCYGVAVWAVMSFLTLNLVNTTMQAVLTDLQGGWFLSHLIFGASLGTVPFFRRAYARGYIDPRSSAYLDRAA